MTPALQTRNATSGPGSLNAIPLLLTEGEVGITPETPQHVMEQIWVRATQVGSVLENILHEPHGQPRWGLNE